MTKAAVRWLLGGTVGMVLLGIFLLVAVPLFLVALLFSGGQCGPSGSGWAVGMILDGTETTVRAYTTGYGWYDNTPPGSAQIARPVIHTSAGGSGTYNDPITVAVAAPNGVWVYPAGTRFYLPNLHRYGVVEDLGDTGMQSPPNGASVWLDQWGGGQGVSQNTSLDCLGKMTGTFTVIVNPKAGYPVPAGSGVLHDGICDAGYGDAVPAANAAAASAATAAPGPTLNASDKAAVTTAFNACQVAMSGNAASSTGSAPDGAWGGFSNGLIPPAVLCPIPWMQGRTMHDGEPFLARCDMTKALTELNTAYRARFNTDLDFDSAYRSYAYQADLCSRVTHACAPPGTSNHGLGLAVDFIVTDGSPQYQWLVANAGRFGIVHPGWAQQPGSGYEPWHWELNPTVAIQTGALTTADVAAASDSSPDTKPK